MVHLEDEMSFQATHNFLPLRNESRRKKLTINIIKLSFVKKTSCVPYPVKRHLIYQDLWFE